MDDVKRLSFKAGVPTILELNCKRNFPADEAPEGRVRTEVDASMDFADDLKTLKVRLTVTALGIARDDRGNAFEATCTSECSFLFDCVQAHSEVENEGFTRIFYEPLYQRAAGVLQDLTWRMGYNAVRLPLMFPRDKKNGKQADMPKPRKRPATRKKPAAPDG